MTLVGTDAQDISYQTGGTSGEGAKPAVAFHATGLNNSNSMGKVVDMGNKMISWWGWSRVAKAAGDAFSTASDNDAIKNADNLKAATAAKQIESTTAIELGKQSLEAAAAVPVAP
jgi:protein-disulfide isomerase-like protein with CxxC motif